MTDYCVSHTCKTIVCGCRGSSANEIQIKVSILETEIKDLTEDVKELNAYRNLYIASQKHSVELRELLKRLHDWDMMDATADGNYWRKEIKKVLEGE